MNLSIDDRINLIKQVGEEIISIDELKDLFEYKLGKSEQYSRKVT